MKALILAALLATAATAMAQAEDNCLIIESYARTVMDARQGGISLKDAMATTEKGDKLGPRIIISAYSKTRYRTEKFKQRAINNFADSVYLECLTIK
jgi:hypothetical protein